MCCGEKLSKTIPGKLVVEWKGNTLIVWGEDFECEYYI